MHHPTDRIAHTTAFVTPVVEYWLEREIAQWVHPIKDRSNDSSHHERTTELHLAPRLSLNTIKSIYILSDNLPALHVEYMYIIIRNWSRKEMFYLTTHSTHFNTVIWRQTYGKGPLSVSLNKTFLPSLPR